MKLSRKLILTLALVLSVAMATTGTLAYLTDRESNANIFTVGNVDITLNEEYVEPSELIPNVKIDKVATITNVGKNPAYVWGTVAVPTELASAIAITKNETNWDWNTIASYEAKIEGSWYTVYTALYNGDDQGVLHPDGETYEMMTAVKLSKFVDIAPDGSMNSVHNGVVTDLKWNINDNSKPVIHVSAYALQSEGVEGGVKGAYDLYTAQWGDPANGEYGGMGTSEENEFVVQNSAELRDALNTIKNDSTYWNKKVAIKLASTTYDGDFVINQYPEWNGTVGAGNSGNNLASSNGVGNVTHIVFEGTGNATFTGNVTVNGWGNAGNGFTKANASTTFNNIVFDGADSADNDEDSIVMYMKAAANNVAFNACEFKNATHITAGGSGADAMGAVTFSGCLFNDGGCISGYAKTIKVNNSNVTAAKNGFINKATAGDITVDNCNVKAGRYFLRTSNSGVHMNVTNSTIEMYESEDEKNLVYFRGSNESANFEACEFVGEYTTKGVDADSTLTIVNN